MTCIIIISMFYFISVFSHTLSQLPLLLSSCNHCCILNLLMGKGGLDLLPQNADIMGIMSVLFVNKKGFFAFLDFRKGLIVSDDTL